MNFVARFCHRFVINALFLRCGQKRQAYFEERAGSDLALHAYLALVGLDNPLHNGQAQPGTGGRCVPWLAALYRPLLPM